MNTEQIAKCRERGITEVLQSVRVSDLSPGDYFVKPQSLTGLPPAYWVDDEGYSSWRADAGIRFEVLSVGAELSARHEDGRVLSQAIVGSPTVLRVVAVP